MFEFVLALARVLVDVPRIAVPSGEDDEILCLDIRGVERLYEGLSDLEKRQVVDCWQTFQAIAIRQNEIHQDAVELNRELLRCIGRDLTSRDLGRELKRKTKDLGS